MNDLSCEANMSHGFEASGWDYDLEFLAGLDWIALSSIYP
jgi:hypothetical protein